MWTNLCGSAGGWILIGFQYMHGKHRFGGSKPTGWFSRRHRRWRKPVGLLSQQRPRFLTAHLGEGIENEPGLNMAPSDPVKQVPRSWTGNLLRECGRSSNFSIWIGHPEDHQAWYWIVRARSVGWIEEERFRTISGTWRNLLSRRRQRLDVVVRE